MKPALALDLDDLIYPFMQTLVPFTNERYGHSLSIDEFDTHNFEVLWMTSREEASRRIHESFFDRDEKADHPLPMNGADLAVQKLSEHYRLFIVTARPDEYRDRTLTWLDQHFAGVFDDVFLCNLYIEGDCESRRTKGSVVEELDAVGLVDDSIVHITEVAEQGRTAILFGDYRWNRSAVLPPNAQRASNWTDVMALLLGDEI